MTSHFSIIWASRKQLSTTFASLQHVTKHVIPDVFYSHSHIFILMTRRVEQTRLFYGLLRNSSHLKSVWSGKCMHDKARGDRTPSPPAMSNRLRPLFFPSPPSVSLAGSFSGSTNTEVAAAAASTDPVDQVSPSMPRATKNRVSGKLRRSASAISKSSNWALQPPPPPPSSAAFNLFWKNLTHPACDCMYCSSSVLFCFI